MNIFVKRASFGSLFVIMLFVFSTARATGVPSVTTPVHPTVVPASTTITPQLTLTYPNSGTFKQGQTVNITWTGGLTSWPVSISLINSDMKTTYKSIVDKTSYNGGVYTWTIPTTLAPGTYHLYIQGNRNDPKGYPLPKGISWGYTKDTIIIH